MGGLAHRNASRGGKLDVHTSKGACNEISAHSGLLGTTDRDKDLETLSRITFKYGLQNVE